MLISNHAYTMAKPHLVQTQLLKQKLKEIYGERLTHIVLFGSQSRNDAVPGSDIDILIVLKGEVSPGKEISRIGNMTSTLSLEYDVVVSCTFVSTERYKTEHSPLLLNIHREGITL